MLSKRLARVLDFIGENDLVADVGTDHGYLLESCLNDKHVKFVQGIENKKGPFDRAFSNLSKYIEDGTAVLSLSDGLTELDPSINTVVIAGMGGELIAKILENDIEKAKRLDKLILEANSRVFELRQFLSKNHFEIIEEAIVYDHSKYYEIIQAKYNENSLELSTKSCFFGPKLMKHQSADFKDKWNKKLVEINEILKECPYLKTLNDVKIIIEEVLDDKSI